MIEFGLSDEELLLRDEVARVLADALPAGRVRELEEAGADVDRDLLATIADLGWLGVAADEEAGGAGVGMIAAAVIAEQLGAALAPLPYVETVCAARLLERYAASELRGELLPELLRGARIVVPLLPLSEPGLQLVEATDGSVSVRGRLPLRRFAAAADLLLTGARHADGRHELVLVDPRATGSSSLAGRAVGGERLAELSFQGARVEAGRRVAAVPMAEARAALHQPAWSLAAAGWCGAARRALDLTVEYAKQRRQFDRSIGSFQAVQHELAWVDVESYGARLLALQAAAAVERGDAAAALLAPEAALVAAAVYRRSARGAVQFHGGYGYTMEYDAQLYLRRARSAQHAWGTPAEIRRGALAARETAYRREDRRGLLVH